MHFKQTISVLAVASLILLSGCTVQVDDIVGDGKDEGPAQTTPKATPGTTPTATSTPAPTASATPVSTPREPQTETSTGSSTTATVTDTAGRTWTQATTGDARASLADGVHTYSVYKCERATSTTALGDTESVTLDFDYELTAEQWWEIPTVEVYVDDERVFRGKVGRSEGETIFDAEAYGTTSGSVSETIQTGGDTEILVGVTPSNYCGNGDHATTTLTLSNLTLSTSNDTRGETTQATNSSQLAWTQNTTGDAQASLEDGVHTYSVYKCERATSTTALGDTESVTLDFDYELTAEQWWEIPTVEVYVDDERVFRGKVGRSEGETIFDAEAYGITSGSVSETIQTGGDTEILVGVTPSNYCGNGDHATTTLTVTDLTVSTG